MSSNHARCVNEIILIRGEAPSLHQANSTGTLASAWKSHCHAQINGYFQIFVLREWKKKGHDSLVHSPLVLFRKNILQSSLFIIFNRLIHITATTQNSHQYSTNRRTTSTASSAQLVQLRLHGLQLCATMGWVNIADDRMGTGRKPAHRMHIAVRV